MLHLSAAQRHQLQQRIDTVMDASMVQAGGKASDQWTATLKKTRDRT